MFAQTDRPIRLSTPLAHDKLILTSIRGQEGLSQLFQFELDTVWQDRTPIKFSDLLGKKLTVEFDTGAGSRYINGIVNSISQGSYDPERDTIEYRLQLVPVIWLLTHRVNCRIFQHKSVPDIIQDILKGVDIKVSLTGSYTPRDYCVQYFESDFAFLSRLMEFEGIYYYFKHESGKHTLVLADSKSAIEALSHSEIEFEEVIGGSRTASRIHQWNKEEEIRSGKFTLVDWNFETPDTNLQVNNATIVKTFDDSKLEIYQNPGGYMKKGDGDHLVKLRMQEEEVEGQVVQGAGWNCTMCPGYKFSLTNHPSENGEYNIVSVNHNATQPYETGASHEGFRYDNQFTCMASATEYRPPHITPAPTIRGVQTAIVVGPAGEEIYTDKYGRIKVQFHWDREGKRDEGSSCWVRVATPWAGKQWGMIHIPRIGQEVIIDFEEGDVDRPLVVGSVYNANLMPPYDLPANMTQSGIKSRSSKGGGPPNFNEIRFEDKKGSEMVFVHAEKDLTTEVEHDESRTVDHDRTTAIKHDEKQTVTNNETIIVEQGNQTITLNQGNQTTRLKMGSQDTKVDMGNQSIKIGMGNQTTKLDLGAADTEAMQSITLKVGQSKIVIDQTGITMEGMMIKITAQVQAQVQATMLQMNGDAMSTLRGGIVMIN